ncbi:MAG: PH domain-containing protein [Promethearchaeota archaeon]
MEKNFKKKIDSYESKFPEEFFKQISKEFGDLRDPKAERKFAKDKAFQAEFKFEPNERLLFLRYQNVFFAIFRVIFGFLIMGIFMSIPFITLKITDILIIIIPVIVISIIAIISIIFQIIYATSYRYIITDRRIIIGYTFIQRWSRSVNYSNIIDITVNQGVIARLFKVGSLNIITGSNEGVIATTQSSGMSSSSKVMFLTGFINVSNPFKIKRLIYRIRRYYEVNKVYRPPLIVPEIKKPNLKFKEYYDLAKDEKIYKIYYRKMSSSFCSLFGIFFGIIISLFQLFQNFLQFLISNTETLITFAASILIISGIIIVILIPLSKYHSKGFEYVVTDRRIIMFKKFLNIWLRDAIMGKITELSLGQQAVGRAANFGTIKVGTKGFESIKSATFLLSINGVADAPKEKDEILNVVLHYQDGKMYSPLEELINPEYFSRT